MTGKSMKDPELDRDTMRAEYRREDLGMGVRGKYYKQYMAGTNVVLLSPDVAKAFPTAESVNSALRAVLRQKQKARSSKARRTRG